MNTFGTLGNKYLTEEKLPVTTESEVEASSVVDLVDELVDDLVGTTGTVASPQ